MKKPNGFVWAIDGDEITIRASVGDLDLGVFGGFATIPRSMIVGEIQQGTYLDVEVDDTLLVTAVKARNDLVWTQEDIDAAERKASELHAKLTAATR